MPTPTEVRRLRTATAPPGLAVLAAVVLGCAQGTVALPDPSPDGAPGDDVGAGMDAPPPDDTLGDTSGATPDDTLGDTLGDTPDDTLGDTPDAPFVAPDAAPEAATGCRGDGDCALARATAACRAGACVVGACAAGWGDCDHDPANGCEADLAHDPGNCGGCGLRPAEVCNGRDDDCNGLVDEGFTPFPMCASLACDPARPLTIVPDPCIDDYGRDSGSDNLEVYCVGGVARFCLSGEACPWRGGGTATDPSQTCSRAGLGDDHLANASGGAPCGFWNGHGDYYCSVDGRVRFAR